MNGVDLATKAVQKFGQVHPGESLDQQCQRITGYYSQWVYQGNENGIVVYPTAHAAALASNIYSTDINAGQVGDFGYWKIAGAWHDGQVVGHDKNDRNRVLVTWATRRGDSVLEIGNDVKVSHADTYDAPFYGWSHTNGRNPQMSLTPWDIQPKPAPTPSPTPHGFAVNLPSSSVQAAIQAGLKRRGRYTGPVDGAFGVNSWKGIQITCRNVGYKGPIDGVPGERTCHFIQVYAAKFGDYAGPIDSDLGPNSWAGFALGLKRP